MNSSLFLLITFLLFGSILAQEYPILESGRIKLYSTPYNNQYSSPYSFAYPSNITYGVVLSLASFTQNIRIGVVLKEVSSTYFKVAVSNSLTAFSYLLVACDSFAGTGEFVALFPNPGVIADSDTLLNISYPINGLNVPLAQFGTIEPFISEVVYYETKLVPKSFVNSSWDRLTQSLKIFRTPDITKVRISFLAYVKIGARYINFLNYDPIDWFNYGQATIPIFIGLRDLILDKRKGTYKFQLISSIYADVQNVIVKPYLININTTKCNGTSIDGVNYTPTMMNCYPVACNKKIAIIRGIQICVPSTSAYSNVSHYSISILNQTQEFGTSSLQCNNYQNTGNSLICKQCNKANHFTAAQDGGCICQQGYYAIDLTYLSDPTCYPCATGICPFEITTSMSVITNSQSSTQYLQINLAINKNYPHVQPYAQGNYQQLSYSITLNNNSHFGTSFSWTSPNQATILLYNYPMANSYQVVFIHSNTMLMHNPQNYSIYSPSQYKNEMTYTKPVPSKFVADSMQTISSVTPAASLVSALLGAKVNLFSFVQFSSALYLSSFIKWNNFGSANRVSLSQSIFKLQPTNFFSTLHINIPVPSVYSDDSINSNLMLYSNSNLMYCSILPQFLLSMLFQILIIQLIARILLKKFPPKHHYPGYKIEGDNGKVKWIKKAYLAEYIDSFSMQFKDTLAGIADKVSTKRFIFYTTLVNSQLVYHSFMIFSSIKINVSTYGQIFNIFFALVMLALIVALPCIGPHTPLVLLKSIGVIYKKREYTIGKLFVFYIIGIAESIVYGASIAFFSVGWQQCLGVTVIILLKMFLMRNYMKVIEKFKYVCLLLFYILLGIGSYFPNSFKLKLEFAVIVLMLAAGSVELLKIVRSIIISILGFLKQPPSIKGKAIIKKVAEYKNIQIQS